MTDSDKQKLATYIREDKWQEAKKLLDGYLNSDLSLEEKGAAYVAFVSTYLDIMNKINEGYETVLDEVLSEIKELDDREKELDEKIRLTHLNSDIDGLVDSSRGA
ncbi:MAG: hypothetical protein Q8Q32_02310 [bacterium]|nr:hypothetical protein [bacterium]